MIELNNVSFSYESEELAVFKDITLQLPAGMTTLVGQNGTGKSTLLLLAGGRIRPTAGSVQVNGIDTSLMNDEESRNRLISFIYQNMEFETEEKIGALLDFVYEQGQNDDGNLVEDIIMNFELDSCLGKRFQENSKGDMQKISIAFSLLYGSPYIMMDEPIFALEDKWKEKILEYLEDFAHNRNKTLYFSIHELDLSLKYSDNALLFSKDHSIITGPSSEVLTRDYLEDAYQIPMELLYRRENLFREQLAKPPLPQELSGQRVKVID
ncbi:ABC transporter ATP-binding protein [Oceanispirochaeta crateris]|uniref:ABC transporter ATP-binding protein n=1 Tax=Oceanispirochaeta crateris TaxID=2518645 RepID=A0A5C1QK77_9SPIO|nr:ABC transporter ATP-binding protein [Oceanispirochaeta crateris]QEN07410.1 ABC transporter ATP-binding protein [Oceanispirochaeta crateris]